MRTYEMMAILAPDIPDEQMSAELDRVAGFITVNGGEVTSLNTTTINALTLGRRRLAYPIRKYRDGFYALYHFNLDPSGVDEVERELRLNTQVLRHLITLYIPPKPKKPKKGEAAATEATDTTDAAPAPAAIATNGATPAVAPAALAAPAETEAERAPVTSASGAEVDTDAPVPPAPDGIELNEPPTAETPETDE